MPCWTWQFPAENKWNHPCVIYISSEVTFVQAGMLSKQILSYCCIICATVTCWHREQATWLTIYVKITLKCKSVILIFLKKKTLSVLVMIYYSRWRLLRFERLGVLTHFEDSFYIPLWPFQTKFSGRNAILNASVPNIRQFEAIWYVSGEWHHIMKNSQMILTGYDVTT